MRGYKIMTVALGVIISTLLGIVAYFNRDSREILGLIVVAASLVLLMGWLSFDIVKEAEERGARLKVPVLISNFQGLQWYATVEIDVTGRLLAPADPQERVLSQADVPKEIDILRAPYFRGYGNTITMLGAVYQIPPIPFGE